MVKSGERRSVGIALIVSGALLLVVGMILAAATSSAALLGAVVGGLPVIILSILLISVSGSTSHVPMSSWRLLVMQPVALAVAATGVAIAVAGQEKGHQFIGGALTAVAIALDTLIFIFWWRDRRTPTASPRNPASPL
jgi:hypothetical protein